MAHRAKREDGPTSGNTVGWTLLAAGLVPGLFGVMEIRTALAVLALTAFGVHILHLIIGFTAYLENLSDA